MAAVVAFLGRWTAKPPGRRLALALLVVTLMAGCEREKRDLRTDPPASEALDHVKAMPNLIGGTPPEIYFALGQPYANNAYNLSQGKRLYTWFNCQTCHGDGSGASGPSFMDGWWNYGPDIVSIVLSIRDGRPQGMPAFRNALTTEQIWQLAGYIQTIGSYSAKTAAPGRDDDKQTRPSENRAPARLAPVEPPSR